MPVAKSHATWSGDIPTGSGHFTAGDSISGAVTYKSRFEGAPGSNPEQLIGAAYAMCFSMGLANALADAGFTAESIETGAAVTLRPIDGVPTITKIELATKVKAPGIGDTQFQELAGAAKAGCPVGRALAGVPDVTLHAELSGQ